MERQGRAGAQEPGQALKQLNWRRRRLWKAHPTPPPAAQAPECAVAEPPAADTAAELEPATPAAEPLREPEKCREINFASLDGRSPSAQETFALSYSYRSIPPHPAARARAPVCPGDVCLVLLLYRPTPPPALELRFAATASATARHNPRGDLQYSSFLIHNSSFLMQNSSFVIQTSSFYSPHA